MTTENTLDQLDIEVEVRAYVDLTEKIEELNSERANIIARLRALEPGKHGTSFGVTVSVSEPSRRFNTTKAWAMLTPEQQAVCTSPDAKKIKDQLPPVIVDTLMEAGTGDRVVKVQ